MAEKAIDQAGNLVDYQDQKVNTDEPSINDISLAVNSGEFVVFPGPCGSGKSTLLRLRTIVADDSLNPGIMSISCLIPANCTCSTPKAKPAILIDQVIRSAFLSCADSRIPNRVGLLCVGGSAVSNFP
ncbi:MAG: ATP-binding cassette domain-containing protein [Granulosicoccus sp.]